MGDYCDIGVGAHIGSELVLPEYRSIFFGIFRLFAVLDEECCVHLRILLEFEAVI